MDGFAPKEILQLIRKIEAKKDDAFRAAKAAEEAEAERLGRIEALRMERRADLIDACARIAAWVDRFGKTVGPDIWRLDGGAGVVIFNAKFWRGEPAPPGDQACSAQLRIGPPEGKPVKRYVYEELHKGAVSREIPILTLHDLWKKTHPDFVALCDAHIASHNVWDSLRLRLQTLLHRD